MRNLNNLNTSILTLGQVQSFENLLSGLAPTESAIASLIEAFDERDVEPCDFVAQSQVDVRVRPWVPRPKAKRASIQWPSSSIGRAVRLINVCAWIDVLVESKLVRTRKITHTRVAPLRCVRSKGVASPVRIEETEMRRGNSGKREKGDRREQHDV